MVADTLVADQTWRLLWCHAARQIINDVVLEAGWIRVAAGYGWGLRLRGAQQRALLVHPTAGNHEAGDLSLTVLGAGTHVIPRAGQSYDQYIDQVRDAVETAAHHYLQQ
jgi:hypothetical protein